MILNFRLVKFRNKCLQTIQPYLPFCPTKAFPGVWEIPVNLHYVQGLAGGQCSYLDQCVFALLGSEDVFEWLQEDFRRHYDVSCQE